MNNLKSSIFTICITVMFLLSCFNEETKNPVVVNEIPSLKSGEVFRILKPNGNEIYKYGDTLECQWIQNVNVCDEAIIRLTSSNGMFWCSACCNEDKDWLIYPRDKDLTGSKSFKLINDSTIMGTLKLPMVNRFMDVNACSLTFRGDKMKIKVFDEYAPSNCTNCFDLSDGNFSVTQ